MNHSKRLKDERWCQKSRILKLLFLFTFAGWLQLSASVYSQETKLNLKVTKASLENVMNNIRSQSQFSFFFDDDAVKKISNITLDVQNASIEEILTTCLANTGFSFRILDKTIILFREKQEVQDDKKQSYTIKGKVVDEKNIPMGGVTIRLDGTQLGVATDVEGRFSITLPQAQGKLIFSFIGYKTQTIAFTPGKEINVKMQEDVSNLEEVQVVAYGAQKKRTVISAISSVKSEDIKELPTHSLENLLQGHMAGVEVSNISGSPGGGGSIVSIRGYSSLPVDGESVDRRYGTPLYVIDGVPMQAFTSNITGSNTLSDLDPSMIESIEVLKDAASAAIYGSRAGNGVILITTKKGRAGQARFSANVSYSASWLPEAPLQSGGSYERYYHLNALRNSVAPYQTADGEWKIPTSYEEVFANKKYQGPMYGWFGGTTRPQNSIVLQDSLNPFYNNSTHWYRQNYRTAKVLNANIQAAGGNEKVRYIVGAGYYDEDGIAVNTGFTRFNVMSNLTAFPTKRLRMDTQLALTYSDRSRGQNAGSRASKIEGISSDANKTSTLLPGNGIVGERMTEILNEVSEKNQSYSLRYNMVLDYEIIRNLHLKASAGVDFNQQNQNTFKPSTLDAYTHFSKSEGTIGRTVTLLNENLLTYEFHHLDKHNFNVMLGLSFQKDQSFTNKGKGINGPNDKVHYVGSNGWGGDNGLNNTASSGENPYYVSAFEYNSDFTEERMNSYFGRLTYNFKEKYMLEATVRRDGSSVFGEDVRWATFPSVAAGWAFSQENFMKKFYWLSFGKIRASWGVSGQKFSQRYLSQGLMMPQGTFHGNVGITPDVNGGVINKKLSWEETNQFDLGLDVSFLDYRLHAVIDYYYRYTKGQLNMIELPGDVFYHAFQWQNGMAVSNQGLEIELEADIFRNTELKWRMKFNVSRNWNRFEKSADGFDFGEQVVGKPLHQLKVYKTEGFYNSQGEVPMYYLADRSQQPLYTGNTVGIFMAGTRRIIDLNGDGKISESDTYFAASPLPLAHGGFTNRLQWKGFDLNIFFNYSIGRHIIKAYDDRSMEVKASSFPIFADLKKANVWTGPESNPDYPKAQMYMYLKDQYTGRYDCDIEKVNFIRLKQITLGYNLNEKITKKLKLQSARVFVTGENLFMLSNYSGVDPELVDPTQGVDFMGTYPLPRKFTVGLSVNF